MTVVVILGIFLMQLQPIAAQEQPNIKEETKVTSRPVNIQKLAEESPERLTLAAEPVPVVSSTSMSCAIADSNGTFEEWDISPWSVSGPWTFYPENSPLGLRGETSLDLGDSMPNDESWDFAWIEYYVSDDRPRGKAEIDMQIITHEYYQIPYDHIWFFWQRVSTGEIDHENEIHLSNADSEDGRWRKLHMKFPEQWAGEFVYLVIEVYNDPDPDYNSTTSVRVDNVTPVQCEEPEEFSGFYTARVTANDTVGRLYSADNPRCRAALPDESWLQLQLEPDTKVLCARGPVGQWGLCLTAYQVLEEESTQQTQQVSSTTTTGTCPNQEYPYCSYLPLVLTSSEPTNPNPIFLCEVTAQDKVLETQKVIEHFGTEKDGWFEDETGVLWGSINGIDYVPVEILQQDDDGSESPPTNVVQFPREELQYVVEEFLTFIWEDTIFYKLFQLWNEPVETESQYIPDYPLGPLGFEAPISRSSELIKELKHMGDWWEYYQSNDATKDALNPMCMEYSDNLSMPLTDAYLTGVMMSNTWPPFTAFAICGVRTVPQLQARICICDRFERWRQYIGPVVYEWTAHLNYLRKQFSPKWLPIPVPEKSEKMEFSWEPFRPLRNPLPSPLPGWADNGTVWFQIALTEEEILILLLIFTLLPGVPPPP
ncbi:hypothetical protein ACFLZ1_03385 [Patescibacteria group bacterium]